MAVLTGMMKRHLCLAFTFVAVLLVLQFLAIRMHRQVAGEGGETERGCATLKQCFGDAWALMSVQSSEGAPQPPVRTNPILRYNVTVPSCSTTQWLA